MQEFGPTEALCDCVAVQELSEDFGKGDGGLKGGLKGVLKVVSLYSEGWCSEEILKILVEAMVVLNAY